MRIYLLVILVFFTFFLESCHHQSASKNLLLQAQAQIESNPKEALVMLDSIVDPQQMDKDLYMQYIVTWVQAKHKCYKDITKDTLIFEAQTYFQKKNHPNQAALANYYAACVNYERGLYPEALISFSMAKESAQEANNDLITARSLNNIGFIYFDNNLFHEAIPRYKEALSYYQKISKSESYQLQTITNIGHVFEAINKLDSANYYYNKGLDLAEKTNNVSYQAIFINQLGIVFREQKKYNEAANQLHKALTLTSDQSQSIKICLSLSKLFIQANNLDSAQYYTNIVKGKLTTITEKYTLKNMYDTLANYNEQIGNYKEANYYNKLKEEVSIKILETNSADKLIEAEKKYQLSLKAKELESSQMRLYLYLAIALILSMLLAGFLLLKNIRHRQEKEKNKLLESHNQLLVTQNKLLSSENKLFDIKIKGMSFLQSIYKNFIEEWTSIEKEVKDPVLEYQASGKPTIYLRIIKMIEDVKEKTNKQLIDSAKELLLNKPSGDKALKVLMDKDLLLLMACYNGYYKINEIAYIMGVAPSSSNLYMQKLDIRNKLERVGAFNQELCEILFPEEEKAKSIYV